MTGVTHDFVSGSLPRAFLFLSSFYILLWESWTFTRLHTLEYGQSG